MNGATKSRRRLLRIAPAVALMAVLAYAVATPAQASFLYRSHFGSHLGFRGHFGHGFGYRSYYGHGFGGGFGHPYYVYRVLPRLSLPQARAAGLGALDLNIKPRADVYLDGRYIGRTGQFDGNPDFLWLKEGTHKLVLFREGRTTVAREYKIFPGELISVKLRLAPGAAVAPETLP